MTLLLDPGEYYMVVSDFAGVPTRYALCAAVGTSCATPSGFLKTSGSQSRVRRNRSLNGAAR